MTATDLSAVYRNALSGKRLDTLRRDVATPDRAEIREVASQFEALFVQTMLKTMRQATPRSELFGSDAQSQYQGLLDQQLALNTAHGQGLGLADQIEREMLRQAGFSPQEHTARDRTIGDTPAPERPVWERPMWERPMAAISPKASVPGLAAIGRSHGASAFGSEVASGEQGQPGVAVHGRDRVTDQGPLAPTPETFVRDIWPHARRTARALGVPARALVAQAALETGWGRHVIRRSDGSSSHNLFNIKAGGNWQGDRVGVPTLEYRDGIAVREHAQFRAYDSVAAAFRDYAALLRGSSRYAEALRAGDDEAAFTRALQRSGYATDPRYAEKIQRILNSDTLSALDGGLKETVGKPTT